MFTFNILKQMSDNNKLDFYIRYMYAQLIESHR